MRRTRQIAVLTALLIVSAVALNRQAAVGRDLEPYRCLEDLNLHELMESSGLPKDKMWDVTGMNLATQGRVFDRSQEVRMDFKEAPAYVGAMCRHLEAQLSSRCKIRKFWAGSQHCSAEIESPSTAITGPDGVHRHQGVFGRVNLFASPGPDGKVHIVLAGSEWTG